jgi:glycine hydroxymethyltransferase
VAGASAYPRQIDFARFGAIAGEVGASLVVDMAHIAGLVAAGLHPSPVPHAALVTSTTHKTLRGPRGGIVLAKAEHAEKLDKSMFPGLQGGPLMHIIAAKAVCFGEALTEGFRAYQRRVVGNARVLGETLVANGFDLVSGGTDNHLLLVDLRRHALTGRTAEEALHRAHMTVNKNAVPNDPQKPWVTSGIRVGTPALTTRGMGEDEMRAIGGWMARVLEKPADEALAREVGGQVLELTAGYPLFSWEPVRRAGTAAGLAG